jgi:hypothetical protein
VPLREIPRKPRLPDRMSLWCLPASFDGIAERGMLRF